MSNNKYFDELLKSVKTEGPQDGIQKYYEQVRAMQNSNSPLQKGLGLLNQQSSQLGKKITIPRPPAGYGAPEKIKVEIIERLTGQIANLCTKYNLSDKVKMETEVTMVEINGTTTVTLTATINWLPNPYVFVAMESYQEPPF